MAYGGSSVFVSNLVTDAFEAKSAASDADKLIRLMREFTNDVGTGGLLVSVEPISKLGA